jgi:hypothetical protein
LALSLGQQSFIMLFLRKSLSDWSPRKTCHVGHGVMHVCCGVKRWAGQCWGRLTALYFSNICATT